MAQFVAYALATATILAVRYIFPSYVGYAALCLLMMAAAPIIYIKSMGYKPGEYLIQVGDWRGGIRISLFLLLASLPIMHYGSLQRDFQAYYPTWEPAAESLGNFALFELYMLALLVSTEVFYRGFLMNQLMRDTRYGNGVHAFVYMLAHLGKPWLEVIYSYPIGWLFGKIDQRYKSILPSILMHFVSSVVFDAMILYQRGIRLI
jgi:membrane protease YdiL (CAAX protease family)